MTTTVFVSTHQFEASHGRKPRGRGGWGFFFDGRTNVNDAWWAPVGTFSEARRAAVVEARRRGADRVEVAA